MRRWWAERMECYWWWGDGCGQDLITGDCNHKAKFKLQMCFPTPLKTQKSSCLNSTQPTTKNTTAMTGRNESGGTDISWLWKKLMSCEQCRVYHFETMMVIKNHLQPRILKNALNSWKHTSDHDKMCCGSWIWGRKIQLNDSWNAWHNVCLRATGA